MIAALWLAACAPPAAVDTDRWTDTVDPDAEHLLATSLVFQDGHALIELRPDLTPVWTLDLPPDSGVQGGERLPNGDTVIARVQTPPVYVSTFDRIDADGAVLWSVDDLALVGFSHGVQATDAGDYIGLDTVGGAVIGFDEAGTELWHVLVSDAGEQLRPNGLHVWDAGGGITYVAVSELGAISGQDTDQVALYVIPSAGATPERLWRVPAMAWGGQGAWPHGPRIDPEGTLTVCHSASGQIVGYDLGTGEELWRLPETGDPARFAFPRDAVFLSDGSLVVADAGAEVVRVADPFGAFQVVAAVPAPGVFGLSPIACGAGGGLPCLGSD